MKAMNGSVVSFRKRGRVIGCSMALALALSALVFAPASASAQAGPTTTYLALGDSISFGYTAEKFNIHYPTDSPSYFEEGFTNYFTKDLAKGSEVGKSIRLVNDACPGETSNGLIGENEGTEEHPFPGKKSEETYEEIEQPPGKDYSLYFGGYQGLKDYHPCKYTYQDHLPLHNGGYVSGGKEVSQLEEAVASISSKASKVEAITINIGSNDELAAITECKDEVFEEVFVTKGYSEWPKGSEHHFDEGGKSEGEFQDAVLFCIKSTAPDVTIPHILHNLGAIVEVLEKSGYTKPIIILGFYNPDAEVLPSSDLLQEAANYYVETQIVEPFNSGYHNVTFANPFPVFNRGAGEPANGFSEEVGTKGAQEQKSICKYTEMCNPNVQTGEPPAGKNGDIHPTLVGYKALAKLVNEAYLANAAK
jgi:lysophospholipase L1-like esterase